MLTGLSAFWFARTQHIVPNHLLAVRPDGRSLECRRLQMLPLEFVVRGYLAGSGWRDYQAAGAVCGHALPPGLLESDRLPYPLVTPATKAATGHDENISEADAAELVGTKRYNEAREIALALYGFGAAHASAARHHARGHEVRAGQRRGRTPRARRRGADARLVALLARRRFAPGGPQPSFDKQFVRDWCERTGWDKAPPGPGAAARRRGGHQARYAEAFELLTGIPFARYLDDPQVVLAA